MTTIWRTALRAILAGIATVVVAWFGLLAVIASAVPDTAELLRRARPVSLTILAADGSELGERGGGRFVALPNVPTTLVRAILAAEDPAFDHRLGIDVASLGWAVASDFGLGREGHRTIVRQLAEGLGPPHRPRILPALREATLAIWLDLRLSNDELLTLYVNRTPFGAGTFGISQAAERYFAKAPGELGLAECAMLAGLLHDPVRDAPTRDPGRARARATIVLDRMFAAGWITKAQGDGAKARPARLARPPNADGSGYFVDWVVNALVATIGRPEQHLVLSTTLQPALQRSAEHAVAASLAANGTSRDVTDGAAIVLGANGAVQALVGGRDYGESTLDHATDLWRQPGSTFKPFVYLTALEEGLRPDSRIDDVEIDLDGWRPRNDDGRFHGSVTLRQGLTWSLNAATVGLALKLGIGRVEKTAHRLGLPAVADPQPSLALGSVETKLVTITSAYTAFARQGRLSPAWGLVEAKDAAGRLVLKPEHAARSVIDATKAETMRSILESVVTQGTGHAAAIKGRIVAGKTGTTSGFRDAWFIGFSGDVVAGVWLGNDDMTPMDEVKGGNLAAELWRQIVAATPYRAQPSPVAAASSLSFFSSPWLHEAMRGFAEMLQRAVQ